MKKIKIIFMLIAVLGFTSISHAQTEAQTLEWLNVKKAEIISVSSSTVLLMEEG